MKTYERREEFHSSPFPAPLRLSPPSPTLRGGPHHRPPTPFRWAPPPCSASPTLRLFSSKTLSRDIYAGNMLASDSAGTAENVREFKKRLRIADMKGGLAEGLDRLGQRPTVRGWVRTCQVPSSVTIIEVNDGSCLSNMQCVISSDAEGYDQVEAGIIATRVSVLVDGVIVSSQGSKQKVELKVERLVMIGKSDASNYPI